MNLSLKHIIRRLRADKSGSIAIIIAASIIPLLIAAGCAFDYGRAIWIKSKFDQVADASALYAVSRPMLLQPQSYAESHAKDFFYQQIEQVKAQQYVSITSLDIVLKSVASGQRNATVTYTVAFPTLFGNILGVHTLRLGGTTSALNALSPNIDFHLLLDTSPSMAFPTTKAGMFQLAQTNNRGCRFACHSTHATKGQRADGTRGDLYSVARSYGIKLRLDAEAIAVSDIAKFSQEAQSANNAKYRLSISEFNIAQNFNRRLDLTDDSSKAAGAVTNLDPPIYYNDKCITKECRATDPGNGNRASASTDALKKMNSYIGTPGTGFKDDSPQSVLLIVTDGMRDEDRPKGQPDFEIDTRQCQLIKNRGIRIGIVYTVYSPESCEGDPYSMEHVAPNLGRIEGPLRECASDNTLFIKVEFDKENSDNDISDALKKLFTTVIQSARITH